MFKMDLLKGIWALPYHGETEHIIVNDYGSLSKLVIWRSGSHNKKGNYDSRDETGMIRYQLKPGIRSRF